MTLKDKMEEQKKRNKGLSLVERKVTEDDYFIPPKLADEFEEIITTLEGIKEGDFGREMGDSNYILKGPPGVGKTLGVQYLATRLGFPLYDGKALLNPQYMAEGFRMLREVVGKQEKPVMVLIDEIDKYSNRDDVVDPVQAQTLNQFLIELDGTESNLGIFLFGATNKPNKLDNALRRPGRFGREIDFMPPDYKGRLNILKIHAGKPHNFMGDEDGKDLEYIAEKTYGYTGSDLKGLMNRAFSRARNLTKKEERRLTKDNQIQVVRDDFDYALKKTTPSALRDMPFKEPGKAFVDVAGYESHKEVMRRIIQNSKGSTIMMYGPEGCGKTEFAEAVAGEYGYNYIVVSGSAPLDKFIGETDKELQKYLDRAKMLAPCVLLFDEIDALVEKEGHESWKGSWTGLLQSQLSKPLEDVYIFSTLNRPDRLNKAFRDRWVHKLFFDYPTREEQEALWNHYVGDTVDLEQLIQEKGTISGRDIFQAYEKVYNYGLDLESMDSQKITAMYDHLIGEVSSNEEERRKSYEEIRAEVGDDVKDYELVHEFLQNPDRVRVQPASKEDDLPPTSIPPKEGKGPWGGGKEERR